MDIFDFELTADQMAGIATTGADRSLFFDHLAPEAAVRAGQRALG